MAQEKLVVFTGAGMSAPSGISTFRDSGGLWEQYSLEEVATPQGWHKNQSLVLEFYNDRRAQLKSVEPNNGHLAIAELEEHFNVVVVTQNVDNLHERAGSTQVIHLHGELTKARSTVDPHFIIDIGTKPINKGDRCDKGGQLRPHIVWFGEEPHFIEESLFHIQTADILVVAGTSLQVYPAAGLINYAPGHTKRYLVDLHGDVSHPQFTSLQGSVDKILPELKNELIKTKAK